MSQALRRLVAMGGTGAIAACSLVNNLDSIGVGDGPPSTPPPTEAGEGGPPADGAVDAPVESGGGEGGGDAEAGVDACGEAGCVNLNAGIAAYWPFNIDLADKSGNGLDLSSLAGPAPGLIAAKFGDGFFAGLGSDFTCGNCSEIGRPTSPALDLSGNFTLSLWVNRSANANVDGTWFHYGIFDNGQVSIGANSANSAPTPAYPTVSFTNGAGIASVQDTTFDFRAPANVGVWTHLIAFRRGGLIGLRVNGKETSANSAPNVGAATATFRMGRDNGGYNWQGVIDEVAVWNRGLTVAEMDALYNGGIGRPLK